MDGPGVKYRLGPGRPVNNCRWASQEYAVLGQNRKGNYEMDNIKLQAAGSSEDTSDGPQVLD